MKTSENKMVNCVCGTLTSPSVVYRKDGFDIAKCPSCGTGRTIVDNFDPAAWYNESYFKGGIYRDYEGSEDTLRHEFRDQVSFLRSFVPGGKLLEVGCAYGFFLQEAKPHFDVYGFEVAEAAVESCHRNGLPNVQQGLVTEDYLKQHGPFDAIVLLDVIEHIDDVTGTMQMLANHLRPDGVVLITTGDFDSLSAKAFGDKWRLLTPPMHLWFFTQRGLTEMLRGVGAAREHLSHPWKLVPFELILAQAAGMAGINWRWSLPVSLRNFGLPANMFDAMRLVYRKG